jgi:hypothetical protein
VLSWSRREVVPYPVLPMTLIQVANGDFSIHSEIDTSAYLFILISWWAGDILEGVQVGRLVALQLLDLSEQGQGGVCLIMDKSWLAV